MKDKPSSEWWNLAKKFVIDCSPEELRLLRILAATELEKRLSKWGTKVDELELRRKSAKAKSIQRNIKRAIL